MRKPRARCKRLVQMRNVPKRGAGSEASISKPLDSMPKPIGGVSWKVDLLRSPFFKAGPTRRARNAALLPPKVSAQLSFRQQGQPAAYRELAWKTQVRLHKRGRDLDS